MFDHIEIENPIDSLFGMLIKLVIYLILIYQLNGEMRNELSLIECLNPIVTVHIYSSQLNPKWIINQTQIQFIQNLSKQSFSTNKNQSKRINSFNRIMGYQGFSLKCSNNEIFLSENIQLEKELLKTGQSYLSSQLINHISKYIGQTKSINSLRNVPRINCNNVPIKGPDSVPAYNPLTDNGGCFITKQLINNCYAYGILSLSLLINQLFFLFKKGVDIVTNTYPQPGKQFFIEKLNLKK